MKKKRISLPKVPVGRLSMFGYDFVFAFRHRFEKDDDILERLTSWREWELGIKFKRYKIVGKKNFNNPKGWKNELIYEYRFGIDLLICKTWFTVQKGGMILNTKK